MTQTDNTVAMHTRSVRHAAAQYTYNGQPIDLGQFNWGNPYPQPQPQFTSETEVCMVTSQA